MFDVVQEGVMRPGQNKSGQFVILTSRWRLYASNGGTEAAVLVMSRWQHLVVISLTIT